jgi:hypothetical protein
MGGLRWQSQVCDTPVKALLGVVFGFKDEFLLHCNKKRLQSSAIHLYFKSCCSAAKTKALTQAPR